MVFYNVEPFGGDTQYLGHAITASTIANVYRKKGAKEYNPGDFMPDFKKKERQTTEQMIENVKMWNEVFKGNENE